MTGAADERRLAADGPAAPAAGAAALELIGVHKRFGGAEVLRGIDLTAPAGRTTVLIGPSGCGKSTILRLMIGLQLPDAGQVRFGGAALEPHNAVALRRRMGYVIQDGGLFPHLTARDNVTLMARHLGWNGARIERRVAELVGLTRFPADAQARYPAQISGGQRQRVSLMRALMLEPDVILLDEPLGAMDPLIRAELQADLRAIFRALAKTVVLVTHDLGEAAFLGDVLVLLRDGAIVQRGTLAQLVRTPADPFVTHFINAQRSPLETL
jgi:osmoprotectant transport system ATP-binding protein